MNLQKAILAVFLLSCFAALAAGQEGNRGSASDAFREVLKGRVVASSALNIQILPETTNIRPRELLLKNGKAQVLSVTARIENRSSSEIATRIAHEWYGGLGPLTDLYVAVKKSLSDRVWWEAGPGCLVGELGSKVGLTVIKPGESRIVDIRLNWPGTGSEPREPLIKESEPGKYTVKFLLFFKASQSQEFVETQELQIEVQRSSPQ